MSWFSRKKFDAKPILDRYMDGDFSAFACGNPAPPESEVHAFERTIGFRLPQDFVDFSVSPLGGIYIEVKETVWPRHKEGAVGPFWSFLYGVHTMGFAMDCPEWMGIRKVREKFKAQSGLDAVPFLKVVGDANVYCFDKRSEVVRWDHETNELVLQKKSFTEIFEFEVAELKARKERKKKGDSERGFAAPLS